MSLLEYNTKGRGDFPKAIVVDTCPEVRGNVRRVRVQPPDERAFKRDIRSIVHLEGFSHK